MEEHLQSNCGFLKQILNGQIHLQLIFLTTVAWFVKTIDLDSLLIVFEPRPVPQVWTAWSVNLTELPPPAVVILVWI